MKKTALSLLIILFLSKGILAQYIDGEKRGVYFAKKHYKPSELPVFEKSRDSLPAPVLDADKGWIDMYWKAWELAFLHFKKPESGSPFVSNYLDEAFSPNIFQWDTIFMIMFSRYGHYVFPAIESLDNFYCRQHENGYICREIKESNGEDFIFVSGENTVNPPIFAWAEVENYKITGDKSRFRMVLPVMQKYMDWLEKYRKKNGTKHDLYWQTGLGSGMDNTPRSGSGWTDMSSQMALMYKSMAKMCDELKKSANAAEYRKKARLIAERINRFMWNEEDGLYYDVDDEGNQIKWKTPACFWPMLAGISSEGQAKKMVNNLKDIKSFYRKIPFPTLAADQKGYSPLGEYWLGAVWAPTNIVILKSLENYGYEQFAGEASERYIKGLYEVYRKTGTLWENYAPDSYEQGNIAKPDFVGWTGCGPIQILIENVLGFHPYGSKKLLEWNIRRTDRHGITNLKFGDVTASLICEKRSNEINKANITVNSDKSFELKLRKGSNIKEYRIKPGKNTFVF